MDDLLSPEERPSASGRHPMLWEKVWTFRQCGTSLRLLSASFKPTERMAQNARLGLRLREQFGRGGTEVGVRRAKQLIAREQLEPADIKSMYSYFARHAVDKNTTRHRWGSETDPSAGYIAWMLWGGDEGKEWVDRQRRKLT